MVDVPRVPPAAPSAPPPSSLVNVAVQQAPAALTAPQTPQTVQGNIVASNPQLQQLTIETPQGQLVVQSAAPLPPGTPVSVQITADKLQTLATVFVLKQTSLQQQALEDVLQPLPPLKDGAAVTALLLNTTTQPLTGLPPAVPAGGSDEGLIKHLLAAYLPKSPAAPAPQAGNAGADILDNNLVHILRAQLQAKITQATLQGPPPTPDAARPATFTPPVLPDSWIASLETHAAPPPKEGGLTGLLKTILPQAFQPAPGTLVKNMYRLDIAKVFAPGTPEDEIGIFVQKTSGAQRGMVDALTSRGMPIIKAGDDHFVVRTPSSATAGSTVIFKSAPAPAESLAPNLLSQPDFDPLQSDSWPALKDALKALQAADHPAAQTAVQLLTNTLPAPTGQMAPTTLFFLAALRTGMVENWLGSNTLQALRQAGKKDLVQRLAGDFEKISAQAKETLSGDWRAITVPLRHDENLTQMQFFVRQQRDENGKDNEGGKPATRFILNLSLSRMGALQLDGFMQKKSFDIVLRTEDKLPFDMRQDIMKRFAAGLDHVQMQGGISFQTRKEGWMVPEVKNMRREI